MFWDEEEQEALVYGLWFIEVNLSVPWRRSYTIGDPAWRRVELIVHGVVWWAIHRSGTLVGKLL